MCVGRRQWRYGNSGSVVVWWSNNNVNVNRGNVKVTSAGGVVQQESNRTGKSPP